MDADSDIEAPGGTRRTTLDDVALLREALGNRVNKSNARKTAETASTIMQTNHATVIVGFFVAILLVVLVVLVGVMLGRRDSSVSNAVHHLLGHSDQQNPALPSGYPNTRHNTRDIDTLIVLGDQWAAGVGAADRASQSWAVKLRDRHCHGAAILRMAQDQSVTTYSIVDQLNPLEPLTTGLRMQHKNVAVIVQAGWNDIVAAQGNDSAIDFDDTSERLTSFALGVASNYTGRAATAAVYMVDYPDPTAGTGYTPIKCEKPLNRVYNHPQASLWHLRALDMWSEALYSACVRHGVAFVPLRDTLRRIGSVQIEADKMHTLNDVQGRHLSRNDNPLPFDTRCGSLNAVGQSYQADLVGAYINNEPYCRVA